MSRTTTTPPSPSSTVCWDHLRGDCIYGDDCPHFHALLRAMTPEPQAQHWLEPVTWYTTPCSHFRKQNGWCPLGDECRFIHDARLLHFRELNPCAPRGAHHCWAYIQGMCDKKHCKFSHPANVEVFMQYTPCLQPRCFSPRCPLKHPRPQAIPFGEEYGGNKPPQIETIPSQHTPFVVVPDGHEVDGMVYYTFPFITHET